MNNTNELKNSLINHLQRLSVDCQTEQRKVQEFLIYTSKFRLLELYRTWMLVMLEEDSVSTLCKERSISQIQKVVADFEEEFPISDLELQLIVGDSIKAMIYIAEHGLAVKAYLHRLSQVIGTMITKLLQFRKDLAMNCFWPDLYLSLQSTNDLMYTQSCLVLLEALAPIVDRLALSKDESLIEFLRMCLGNDSCINLALSAISRIIKNCKIQLVRALSQLSFAILEGVYKISNESSYSKLEECVKIVLKISDSHPQFFFSEVENLSQFCEAIRDKFKADLGSRVKVDVIETMTNLLICAHEEKKVLKGKKLFLFP